MTTFRIPVLVAALALAAAACSSSGDPAIEPTATGTPTGSSASCSPPGTELTVVAVELEFDTDCLAAPADTAFTIEFDNQDTDQHNVSIYTDSSAAEALFTGEIFGGPETKTYEVPAIDAGDYFFRCDVHPADMTGTFVVA